MNYLKEKLKEKNISQSEFARRMNVSRSTISRHVNKKKHYMTMYQAVNMALILDIPIDEFVENMKEKIK